MYDELNEELKQMDEIEKEPIQKVEGSLSLSDSIQSMPKQKFLVIKEDTTLKITLEKLQQYHLGCVVIEKDKKVKGIFTERDILMKILGKRFDFQTEIVKDFMTKNPTYINKDALAVKALEIMNKKKITSLIVAATKANKKQIKAIGIIHIHKIIGAGIK